MQSVEVVIILFDSVIIVLVFHVVEFLLVLEAMA